MSLWNSTHTREASTNYKSFHTLSKEFLDSIKERLLRTVRAYIREFLESIKTGSFLTSTREVIAYVRVMGTVRARVQLIPMLASFRTS